MTGPVHLSRPVEEVGSRSEPGEVPREALTRDAHCAVSGSATCNSSREINPDSSALIPTVHDGGDRAMSWAGNGDLTRREAISLGAARLRAAGIETPRLEARLLLAQATGTTPETLLGDPDRLAEIAQYEKLLRRREAREPLALILGHREFWSMEFAVSDATLVPRPDSEALIEAACAAFADSPNPPRRILDLGTGTGCLLLATLAEFPAAFGVGVDVSPAAVSLARRNAAMLGFGDSTAFIVADWGSAVTGRFDLVIANPPYVARAEIPLLIPEVGFYEPRGALDGGVDGLDAYRVLVPALPALLASTGVAVFEIGFGQAAAVAALAADAGLTTSLAADLAGTPRAIVFRNASP